MAALISRDRLLEILNACRSMRIGVLGDFALDAYWTIDMTQAQLSREAPLFNRPVVKETYSLGGAANVAWNLAELGVKDVLAFTVFGDDWRAAVLRCLLEEEGIQLDKSVVTKEWSTITFAKILLSAYGLEQEDSRLDFINSHPLPPNIAAVLLSGLESCLPNCDALVIADYQPISVISPTAVESLNSLAQRFSNTLFVVDSRDRIGQYHNMVLKPNRLEVVRAGYPDRDPAQVSEADVIKAGQALQVQTNKPVFITLGENGCFVLDNEPVLHLPAVKVPPPIDTVGAGDTFLAALAATLAAGASSAEAGFIACLASAVTVRKLRVTGTATPAEILALFEDIDKENH